MKRQGLVLAIAAAVTVVVLASTQVTPARATRDLALEQFTNRIGDCVQSASLEIAWNVVETQIKAANGRAGWIDEGVIFIGSVDEAAKSLNAEILASDSANAWLMSVNSGRLLGFRALMVGNIQAHVINEISRPC